ncbi:MAG: ComEA family DNA-binding protein [Phycisphaerales bacterium]
MDWSRGPVASAIALIVVLACAALLPWALRERQAPIVHRIEPSGSAGIAVAPPPAVVLGSTPPVPGAEPIVAGPEDDSEAPGVGDPDSPTGAPTEAVRSHEPDGAEPVSGLLININTASSEELQLLPRIGPALSARIIADREANGPFANVDELDRVRGIGAKTLEGLRDRITVGRVARQDQEPPVSPASTDPTEPSPAPAAPAPAPLTNEVSPARLNINTATQDELETLPGIGPALARRIIEERRTNGPFVSVDDLERVRGIGPASVQRLRLLIVAGR